MMTDAIPQPVLYTAIAALCTTIIALFRMLLASQERRNSDTLAHHQAFVGDVKIERQKADDDRQRYITQLETLVTTIASERNVSESHMITTLAANTEAIHSNTKARETASADAERLMKELTGIVILKLVELGYLIPMKPLAAPAQA